VDLVMEGGGMLGIALVGYTWALEQAGLRFLGLGGTSAGSINALLLAALGPPAQAKGPQLLQDLAALDFRGFVDGGRRSRRLIDAALEPDPSPWRLAWRAWRVRRLLKARLGLNPGAVFQDWIHGVLAREGVSTLEALQARLAESPPGLWNRRQNRLLEPHEARGRLAIVASRCGLREQGGLSRPCGAVLRRPGAGRSGAVRAGVDVDSLLLRAAAPERAAGRRCGAALARCGGL
jgi:NTE family protein